MRRYRFWRGLTASDCGCAVGPFWILCVGGNGIGATSKALYGKAPLDRNHDNRVRFFKKLVCRAGIGDLRAKADMPVCQGPIAVRSDKVEVIFSWWWLVEAGMQVWMRAMVDSAFELGRIHVELLLPLTLAVPELGLLLACLVNVMTGIRAAVADH